MENTAFITAVKAYRETKNLTIAAMARELGKGESTIGDWIKKGIGRDDLREKVVAQYPQVFGSDQPAVANLGSTPSTGSSFDLKIEAARLSVGYLSGLLEWFLYTATREERNRFRDELGNQWKHFLELTRGMTSEAAFDVAKSERRL